MNSNQEDAGWRADCTVCFQPKTQLNPWVFQRYPVHFLRDGADSGCRTCRLRLNAAVHFDAGPDAVLTFLENPPRFFFDSNRKSPLEIFNVEARDESNEYSNLQSGYLLSTQTSSEQTFKRLQAWVADCTENHTACSTNHDAPDFMPKRVVDVRFGKTRLREGLHHPQPYVCLSHCWGKLENQIRTLSSNIDDFKLDGIPDSALTRTFREAADVTRRLGIDYLWIDSLCIIQDSKEDWAEQSLQMGNIYEKGAFTIAATASTDGNGGLFRTRDEGFLAGERPIAGESVFVRRKMPIFKPTSTAVREMLVSVRRDYWPLLDRGWVFQEMSLSSRVLHFGEQEVVWQCRTGRRSESGSNDVAHWSEAPSDPMHSISSSSPSQRSWYEVVEKYSGLSLTFESDRLPAISAMAQRIAETRPGVAFLAGLWQDTLLEDLLWEVPFGEKPLIKPIEGIPPSWSWASVRASIRWYARMRKGSLHKPTNVKVLDINVVSERSPFLGPFVHSELHLRCAVINTTLGVLRQREANGPGDSNASELPIGSDITLKILQFTEDYEFNLEAPGHIFDDTPAYILPLMVQDTSSYHSTIICLAVRLIPGAKNRYERLGHVMIAYWDPEGEKNRIGNMGFKMLEEYGLRQRNLDLSMTYVATLPTHHVVLT